MKRLVLWLALWAALAAGFACTLPGPEVVFTDSDLPIFLLDTGGEAIVDEPKRTAHLVVIDNGPGVRNHVTDPPTDYNGPIGIERRGASSQKKYPKKQYAFETRTDAGDNRDVSLLGMPPENDWVLQAPYGDKTLMRNVLAYHLARQMGHYASRARFCEVVLNGVYQGVYVLMEKIKRDDHRVDLHALAPEDTTGEALTGGYLLQIDRRGDARGAVPGGWDSPIPDPDHPERRVHYRFEDPDADDLAAAQKHYIQSYLTTFEAAMASAFFADSTHGYPAYLDLASFVDFFLLTELSKNVDGYRLSTYLYKARDAAGGLLHAGPVWDFNLAFGNANYYDAASPTGFRVDYRFTEDPNPVPFWWRRLAQSPSFRAAVARRWAELRTGVFHEDTLMQTIDEMTQVLDEAQARNFTRWPILGNEVWPNAFVGATYAEEVGHLKQWLRHRLAWLDATLL